MCERGAASVYQHPARFARQVRYRPYRPRSGCQRLEALHFLSFQELAELHAKGVLDEYGFSVRMCVPGGNYPKTTPTKKLLPAHIKLDSPFELAVQGVDVSKPATRELKMALFRTGGRFGERIVPCSIQKSL